MPTPMHPIGLSETIAVGEAPTVAEIEILAKAGFRSLINTQPDGELDRQMPSSVSAAEAARQGMAYRTLPVESRYVSAEQATMFAAAMVELPKPIYAYCYSGARAAAAWAMAEAPNQDADALIAACKTADFDIVFLKPQLEARRVKPAGASAAVQKPAATPISAILPSGASNGTAQPKVTDVVNGKTSPSSPMNALTPDRTPLLPIPHRISS